MPGRDFISTTSNISTSTDVDMEIEAPRAGVYYNARLDPKNYLEGPLSHNAATRLRQMLARPGIVVSLPSPHRGRDSPNINQTTCSALLVFATVSVPESHWRLDLIACTRGQCWKPSEIRSLILSSAEPPPPPLVWVSQMSPLLR